MAPYLGGRAPWAKIAGMKGRVHRLKAVIFQRKILRTDQPLRAVIIGRGRRRPNVELRCLFASTFSGVRRMPPPSTDAW
jgi:hypothetical protein